MSNGLIERAKTGEKTKFIVTLPTILIDSHMHIQSSHCTPLPLFWGQQFPYYMEEPMARQEIQDNITSKWRSGIIYLAKPGAPKAAKITYQNTFKISNKATSGAQSIQNDSSFGTLKSILMIMMPMDMEYAHLAGYDGIPIYDIDKNDRYKWFKREWVDEGDLKKLGPGKTITGNKKKYQPTFGITKLGSLKIEMDKQFHIQSYVNAYEVTSYEDIPSENSDIYHDWKKQVQQTEAAAVRHPWQLLPMHHFEPRRYTSLAHNYLNRKGKRTENWNNQLDKIATSRNTGLYLGFKMYCSLGYQPRDPKIEFLNDLSFYKQCADNEIPILVHNTSKGMVTHDMEFYYYNLGNPRGDLLDDSKKLAEDYFQTNLVHPDAWEKVLNSVSNLKLCLAHFGGGAWSYHEGWNLFSSPKDWKKSWVGKIIALAKKYENLYTDVSYLFTSAKDFLPGGSVGKFKDEMIASSALREKILFGTDWILTEIDSYNMSRFSRQFKNICDDITEKLGGNEDFWEKITILNPLKFYGLDNEQKLSNLKNAMLIKLGESYDLIKEYEPKPPEKGDLEKEIDEKFESIKKIIKRTMNMNKNRNQS